VCGRCLDFNSRGYLRQQLQQLQQLENLSQAIIEQNTLQNQLALLLQQPTPNFDSLLLAYERLQDDLEDLQQNIKSLKNDTEGVNQAEVAEMWKKVGKSEKDVEAKKNQIDRLNQEITQKRQELDRLRRERETLVGQNQETVTLAKQLKLAEGLRDATDELIEWYIRDRQQKIETETSKIHRQVTNKPNEYRGVVITERYTLGVKTINGEELNPEILSPGEKEALAFAFITGLNLASETAAPLVMDTPFGHLDTEHQRNIVRSLPDLPSQVIVLATDRDFPDYLLNELRPHVAEIHHIHRLEATEDSSTVEVEE
jgi:DNA sulfur modification protein DndD